MASSTSLTFRCPDEVLEAIDGLGKERHPSAATKHGCDRSKTLMDIVRAGIEALSNGAVVLPLSDTEVRQGKTENTIDIEARFAGIEERLGKLRA